MENAVFINFKFYKARASALRLILILHNIFFIEQKCKSIKKIISRRAKNCAIFAVRFFIMAGIYVHIPFCKQKCVYCAFYSVASDRLKEAYWDALCREIELRKSYLPDSCIDTLYFGGGTPSLCSSRELERIINKIHQYYTFNNDFEFTLEANPEQLTKDYLLELKSLGINRLSIGIQSFDDSILHLLNRRHSAEEALRAVETAAAVGFQNISIDLIYDIAFRTAEMWQHDLQVATSLPIQHLSCYSLTVEENTLLARRVREGQPYLPDDADTERDYAILSEMTARNDFQPYEISNFARNGHISRHNSSYWYGEPYLGLGAAAHSFCSPSRQWNVANIQQYINGMNSGKPEVETETLSPQQQYDEFVLLRLRLNEGLRLEELEERFGRARLLSFQKQLHSVNPAHYTLSEGRMQLTYAGRLFADNIAATLFAD